MRSPFNNNVEDGLQAVPAVATDLTTTDTYLYQLTVANVSAGALTFTLADKQPSPLELFKTTSITAGTVLVAVWPQGLKLKGGLNWQASGVGLNAEVLATYK